MHHKAPDSIWIEVRPKRHGPERRGVDILGIIALLGLGRGQNKRVMPLQHDVSPSNYWMVVESF
jgi:hypothetical protein